MTNAYALQIGGTWLEIDEVDLGSKFAGARAVSEWTSLGGVRRRQRSARMSRVWSWNLSSASAQTARWVVLAAQGLAGEVWLYDLAAAQANMLDPRDVVGRVSGQPTISVDGVAMRTFAAGYTLTRKLRAAQIYTLSGWTSHTHGVAIGTYDVGAGAVDIVAPAGAGSRYWEIVFTPTADVTATFVVTVASKTSGLRLTEGARVDTIRFMPGENTPCQVSVDDPERTLKFLFSGQLPLTDYTVSLVEVG
jgi:hypothetical protein